MPKPLANLGITAPGAFGLNKQQEGDILDPRWAVEATNLVIDDSGRLASRKGFKRINTGTGAGQIGTLGTEDIEQVFEYVDGSGNTLVIFAVDNKIYKDDGDGTVTDISGTITTPTANNWKFQNFNGKCIGWQTGHTPIVLSTVGGSFADITLAGAQQPGSTTNEILAAYGRVWALDGTDLKYSDALDETTWNGVFDLSTVWLSGMDTGSALAEFNGHLVVFGERSIVVYNNPWSPSGGGSLDTTQMTLVENISGIGCVARDSVQNIGTDLLFLSSSGIRSLGRTIQEKSMPVNDVSRNVRDYMLAEIDQETNASIRSVYFRDKGFYLLALPGRTKCFYFDVRQFLGDGSSRTTEWNIKLTGLANLSTNKLYAGRAGYIVDYEGYLDDRTSADTGGSTYRIKYKSGWTDFGEELSAYVKIPKKLGYLLAGGNGLTINMLWSFDYDTTERSLGVEVPLFDIAEYGEAEYGEDEYSGGTLVNKVAGSINHTGQAMAFGMQTDINNEQVSIQRVNLQIKVGRTTI